MFTNRDCVCSNCGFDTRQSPIFQEEDEELQNPVWVCHECGDEA